MISLKFEKIYKHDRKLEPCSVALPYPKGRLWNKDSVRIKSSERSVISQAKITSYWEDGSIRWLFVRFLVNLPGNSSASMYAEIDERLNVRTPLDKTGKLNDVAQIDNNKENFEGRDAFFCQGIQVTKQGESFIIDTGALSFSTALGSGIFEEIKLQDLHYRKEDFTGPIVLANGGKHYELKIDSWTLVEAGPVCVILEASGYQVYEDESLKVTIQVSSYYQKPWVEVAYRLFNSTKKEISFDSISYQIRSKAEVHRTCVASSNYRTKMQLSEQGDMVTKIVDAEELLYEANEHISEVFYGTLFTDTNSDLGGICATIYQAQQNYPKGVTASKEGICISLIPEGATKIRMQSGMAREQRFLLHLHDKAATLEELNHRSLIYQMPDRPALEPRVYQEAGVFQDIFMEEKRNFIEIALIAKADSHARCYGMLNWGDSPDPGYTTQGRGNGEPVWTNNEYDFPHACALMYVRSGTRRFLDYLLVAGRHWMDVDICHYSENPLELEGQWEHTNRHVLNGKIVCSHQWVEGLLDYYHFTGDQEALHSAIGIGKNILRLLETPIFQQKGEINARETGWAMRSLVALYQETHDEQWLERCDWIVGHFEEWEKEYGHWLSPYTDNTEIRVVFMISIAVGSLMRYYRIRPQNRIKSMILRAVDDMIENCYMEYGIFYYKELPSLKRLGNNTIILEALTIAYELTKDSSYLTYGKTTFEMAVKNVESILGGSKRICGDALIGPGPGTKNFAQSFIPIVSYYKAAVQEKII